MKIKSVQSFIVASLAIHLSIFSVASSLISSSEKVLLDLPKERKKELTDVISLELRPGDKPGPTPLGDDLFRSSQPDEPGGLPPGPAAVLRKPSAMQKKKRASLPLPMKEALKLEPGEKIQEKVPTGHNVERGLSPLEETKVTKEEIEIPSEIQLSKEEDASAFDSEPTDSAGTLTQSSISSEKEAEGTSDELERAPGGTGGGKARPGSRFGVPGGTGGRGNELNRFSAMVQRKIEQAKFYPPSAKREGMEGAVGVRFVILADGRLEEVSVVHPSPHAILNMSAQEVIAKAAPFRPMPEGWQGERLVREITIEFKLEQ